LIPAVLEGDLDIPLAKRPLALVHLELGTIYGRSGKGWLDQNLARYNAAARHARWFGMRDLDSDAPCASELVQSLLPHRADAFCFRVPVRAAEAWLLADRERIAEFLRVAPSLVPTQPELLADPKLGMVNLARRSRNRAIQLDMVPAPRTTARVGPGYTGRIVEFTLNHWRPRVAAHASLSLARCIAALERWADD